MKFLKTIFEVVAFLAVVFFYFYIVSADYETNTETAAALMMIFLFIIAMTGKPKLIAAVTTIFWCLATWLIIQNYDTIIDDINNGKEPLVSIVGLSIWLWIFVRWVVINIIKKENIKLPKGIGQAKAFEILFKTIIAPIIVSLIIYFFTGQPTLTIVSVPIIGIISASINIG